MNKRIGVLLSMAVLGFAALLFFLSNKEITRPKMTKAGGPELFGTYCSACHGPQGKGDGQLAYVVYPKPRDFTKGVFKLRSTPSGRVPTDEDLVKTIKSGMPGTAMPSFYYLQDAQIKQVVQYVKQLSQECTDGTPCKNLFEGQPPSPISVPEPPLYSNELVARGKDTYKQLGCHQCHGEYGKGDGQSAAGLKDDWGYPIQVRDFTQGTYLGGGAPKDLYLRFMTGLNGTPMPSYGEAIQYMAPNDPERQQLAWGLVYYVKSLETEEAKVNNAAPPKDGVIFVAKTQEGQPDLADPSASDWQSIPAASIPVSRLWQKQNGNASVVQVRAKANKESIALLLEWEDESHDAGAYGIQDFQDAAAIQFSLTGEPGFHGMGQKTDPCNLWFWRSEWQMRKDMSRTANLNDRYRNKASDAAVSSYPAEIQEETILAASDAGNIVSSQKITSPVEDINAAGPGTLTSQPSTEQNVFGKGAWDGKKWRVVFVRKLRSDEKDDIQFKTGNVIPVAFAIWNGSERDRNGQKFVSTWYSLQIQN